MGFNVDVDLARGLFETRIEGFWALEDVAAFGRAVTDAGARIAATGRAPVSLCDYTGAAVQSQEVIAALQALMENPVVRSRRVAMYTAGPAAHAQAARATRNRDEFRFFDDRAAAERWLLAD
jgi:hypothetical protein